MLFAVGGLPFPLLEGAHAESVLDIAEQQLWTPLGPRTLSPRDPRYQPTYAGGPAERDAAYHQGTVWPWLAGAFVEGWVRVRGNTAEARQEARERFLPGAARPSRGGGARPRVRAGRRPASPRPRGCPFQAWSLGELIRIMAVVLADPPAPAERKPRRTAAARAAEQPAQVAHPGPPG
jgi:glycogen debranching enzyme